MVDLVYLAMGIRNDALILNFAFYNFGSSFYKILYLASKRTNPSLFVVQMVWEVGQLVALIIESMVGKGIGPNVVVLAFIQKIIAVSFDYKYVLYKTVFLMNM